MGRPHLHLLAAERLQSAWLAQVHGDAVVGRASHSIGTSESRIPCAGCWMGRSCSQSGFALQGAGLGASGLLQSGVKGRKPRSGPPTLGCCWLGGGRGGQEQLPSVVLGPGEHRDLMGCLGDSPQPPASRGVTTRSFPPFLRQLLALEWERRRLLVSTQGSPFAQGLSGRAALCTSLGMAVLG